MIIISVLLSIMAFIVGEIVGDIISISLNRHKYKIVPRYGDYGYCGEYLEDGSIIVFHEVCGKNRRNIDNVILHEKVHYYISKTIFIKFIIERLTSRFIKKCRKRGIVEWNVIYFWMPEERLCDWIADKKYPRFY